MQHDIRRTSKEAFAKLPVLPKNRNAKILHLTHSDMDGEGAAMMLAMLPYDITVRRLTNNNMSYEIGKVFIQNESKDYDFIIVTDISCSRKVCDIIARHQDAGKLIILDHHQTSDYLNDYPFGVCQSVILSDSLMTKQYRSYFEKHNQLEKFETLNLQSSGTSLMMDYMWYQGLLDMVSAETVKLYSLFANCIRCYDTWDWKLCFDDEAYTRLCPILNILYDAYGAEGFKSKMSRNMKDTLDCCVAPDEFGESDIMRIDDYFIIQCEETKIKQFVDSMQNYVRTGNLVISDEATSETKYYSVAYISCNRYLQEVFDMMKNTYPATDIYIINYGSGLSFRVTREDINIGQLVTRWNGGGHAGAAGIKIPMKMTDKLICEDVLEHALIFDEKEGD